MTADAISELAPHYMSFACLPYFAMTRFINNQVIIE